MLWLLFTGISLGVVAVMAWPILRGAAVNAGRAALALDVYRDQLVEIERDRSRGLLDDAELNAARLEIHRRMLSAEEPEPATGRLPLSSQRRGWRLAAALSLIPVGGFAVYAMLGSPSLPGRPFAERQSDPVFQTERMIAHVQTEVAQSPSANGYKVLGDLQVEQRRYDRAAEAYHRAVALGEDDAEVWSTLGESIAMNNDGAIMPDARADFLRALKLDREEPRARFYLGLAEAQIGDNRKAVAIWRDLERDSGEDAPWLIMLREHIAVFSRQGGFTPDSVAPAGVTVKDGGPTGPMADALRSAAPDDQTQMIRSMVDGLAVKLASDPSNLDGWLRLARAYKVLGESGKAEEARSRAATLIAALPAGVARDEAQERLATVMN